MSGSDVKFADTVIVEEWINKRPFSARQLGMVLVCLLIAVVEGYDVQAMAFAAPTVVKIWMLSPQELGLLLTASVVGLLIGTIGLAPSADRFGRRPLIIVTLLAAGILTFAGGSATNYWMLLALRVGAGIGLGATMSNLIVLAVESLPSRFRMVCGVVIGAGYPVGAAVGALLTARLVPEGDWRTIFLAGGSATVLIALLAFLSLSESPLFLARNTTRWPALVRLLNKTFGSDLVPATRFEAPSSPAGRSKIGMLFEGPLRPATLMLWMASFANQALLYFLISWLPSLFSYHGHSPSEALRAAGIFNAGALAGGLGMAWIMTRMSPSGVLRVAYILGAAAVFSMGLFSTLGGGFYAVVFIAGICVTGSQFCLTVVISQTYPTSIRATGQGFANGSGRVGAILAPLVGGILVAQGYSLLVTLSCASGLAVLAAVAVHFLARHSVRIAA